MRVRLSMAVVGSLAAAAFLVVPAPAGVPMTVTVDDDFFDPDVVTQGVSLSVAWQWSGNNAHNVRQDSKLFRSGNPVSDRPPFTIFPSAGTYHYYCEEHGTRTGGMDGVMRVRPSFGGPFKRGGGAVVPIVWANATLETGDQFDVQYKVGNGKWKYWRKNTANRQGQFGKNGKPVKVNTSKTYRIRARSEKSSNPKKRSGWSPPLLIAFP